VARSAAGEHGDTARVPVGAHEHVVAVDEGGTLGDPGDAGQGFVDDAAGVVDQLLHPG
jgi:hypothetical protein